MPSYDQLDNEEAWRDEVAAPALAVLASRLRSHFPGAGVWIRGDNGHVRGYHRSRRWINTSVYCTDRNYSVTRTLGDRQGGDGDWSCAIDIAVAQSLLIPMCQRLDAACRAGRLEKITEWFGNTGGDQRVDGWDNISNRVTSAGSSHLTHLHISFDRGRANEDHTDLYLILIGAQDVNPQDVQDVWNNFQVRNERNMGDNLGETWQGVRDIKNLVEDLVISPIDVAALATAIAAVLLPQMELKMEEAAERAVRDVLGTLDNPST